MAQYSGSGLRHVERSTSKHLTQGVEKSGSIDSLKAVIIILQNCIMSSFFINIILSSFKMVFFKASNRILYKYKMNNFLKILLSIFSNDLKYKKFC